jgi:hypothetical protein
MLGHTMHAGHLFSVVLVLAVQWILLAIGGTSAESIVALPVLLLALLLPVPGYLWALRDAPLGLKTHGRVARITVVGLASFGLSLVGFILGLVFFASRVRVK